MVPVSTVQPPIPKQSGNTVRLATTARMKQAAASLEETEARGRSNLDSGLRDLSPICENLHWDGSFSAQLCS